MLHWMTLGGWVMWLLLACSIAALSIVFERAWVLRVSAIAPEETRASLSSLLTKSEIDDHELLALSEDSPLGALYAKGLVARSQGIQAVEDVLQNTGRHIVSSLHRRLSLLGSIAMIAPLLGLLGTVLGMMDVFQILTQNLATNPASLAGGIGKTLVTTAFGLIIAIPAVVAHRFFERRIEELAQDLELESVEFIQHLRDSEQTVLHSQPDFEASHHEFL